jgi:hypothetical protein
MWKEAQALGVQEKRTMDSEAFNKALSKHLGYGYIRKFTELTGLSHSQVSRYANDKSPIPHYVALIVAMLPVVIQAGRTDVLPNWAEITAPKRGSRTTD